MDQHRKAPGLLTNALVTAALLAPVTAEAQALLITRGASRSVRQAPADNFTGVAHVDRLFTALNGSDASGGTVAFEAGARTAWHSHPGGQTLIVTAGTGRVQRWGDPVQEIRAGDVVRIPPGQKHWHGASPQAAMTHIAITEPRGGAAVEWMEPVTDTQFHTPPVGDTEQGSAGQGPQAPQPPAATQAPAPRRPSGELQQRLAPGLATLTDDVLYGDVWRRPALSARDRSLVTIAVLVATGKTAQLTGHLTRGLENGLRPSETSGLLAHLAVYAGWPNAVSALPVYEQVYTARKVDTSALRATAAPVPARVPEAGRPSVIDPGVADVAPKFAQLTTDVVFGDLWRRSDLSARDRSLVTIAALAATGDDDQLGYYVRLGAESGLSREQIAEALTHLAFYAGWGRASTAMTAMSRALAR